MRRGWTRLVSWPSQLSYPGIASLAWLGLGRESQHWCLLDDRQAEFLKNSYVVINSLFIGLLVMPRTISSPSMYSEILNYKRASFDTVVSRKD